MTSDRTKSRGAFWITVTLLAVLLAYPLSFGPACWIASRIKAEEKNIVGFYQPVLRVVSSGPAWLKRAALWYAAAGVGPRDGSYISRDAKTGHCHWTYAVP